MSVLDSFDDVFVISHELFLKSKYNIVKWNGVDYNFTFLNDFFNIKLPFKVSHTNKKHNPNAGDNAEYINYVQDKYNKIKDRLKSLFGSDNSNTINLGPKEAADKCYLDARSRKINELKGGNLSLDSLVVTIGNENYLIPPICHFFNYDVKDISKHLHDKFDVVVLDPPWWNKYIRRKRARNSDDGYNMMWNQELALLPIGDLIQNNGLIVVWCTNAPSHFDALVNEIFPRWGVKFLAQWFWLKVTRNGEVVTPFSSPNGKQPFEKIIFGFRDSSRSLPLPETGKVIISVPSSIHSHKPPLCDLLKPFIPQNAKCLEVFARYLLPNWSSYGNEVLKLQHLSLFKNGAVQT